MLHRGLLDSVAPNPPTERAGETGLPLLRHADRFVNLVCYLCIVKRKGIMRFEVYDENYEVMASFNEYLDALDYFNDNPCKFVYDTILDEVVEGSDK